MESDTAVLNISGISRKYQNVRRKKKETPKPNTIGDDFPAILSKFLLKSNVAVQFEKEFHYEYLGVGCLLNKRTNKRIYHIFCTIDPNIGKDYAKVQALYENQPDIVYKNNITMYTISAKRLYRNAKQHFEHYNWIMGGNAFETPCTTETDISAMWKILHDLECKEVETLFSFIKFMSQTKHY